MLCCLFSFKKCVMITNILLVFNKTCSFMQKKNQFDRRSTTQKSPSFTKSPQLMNNSYFVCDVAPMKLCYPHAQQSIVCNCMHLLLHNNVKKRLHKNFMPLLTHENAWKLMYNIHGSNMASSVYSWLFMGCMCTSSLFAGLQVRWYYIVDFIVDFQWVFVGKQCRAGNFKNLRSGVSFCRSNCNKIIKRKTWPQQ